MVLSAISCQHSAKQMNPEVNGIKNIIFDFDGVLVESNEIRFKGFELLLGEFPKDKLSSFMEYVRSNGGISRYEKIRYFYRDVLKEPADEQMIYDLADQYSKLV